MKVIKHDPVKLYGKEYKKVLACIKRYLVIKGSRASKKSKNIALRWIKLLMQFPLANLLVVRKFGALLKQSCRADLIWAIKRLGVEDDWKIPKGEMTLTRKSTGQVIIFRGLKDPEGITSIAVDNGVLNFCWLEEAYQIDKEEDFDMLDEAIRGTVPEGYFKQIVLTFNPWHERHWLRKRFYLQHDGEELDNDVPYVPNKQKSSALVLALTRNYECNEFLDPADLAMFERMKIEQPQRYRVAGLGEWGVSGETIYDNYEIRDFNWKTLLYEKDPTTGRPMYEHRIGLDFGYSHNTAGVELLVDRPNRIIYICNEFYEQRLSTDEIYLGLREHDWAKEPIHADSEDPKTIRDLHKLGCPRIFGVKKEPGSVWNGIQELLGYRIVIHPTCENTQIEIEHYAWKKDKDGRPTNQPEKEWDHLMDAMRYAMVDDAAGVEFLGPRKAEPVSSADDRTKLEARLRMIKGGYRRY